MHAKRQQFEYRFCIPLEAYDRCWADSRPLARIFGEQRCLLQITNSDFFPFQTASERLQSKRLCILRRPTRQPTAQSFPRPKQSPDISLNSAEYSLHKQETRLQG